MGIIRAPSMAAFHTLPVYIDCPTRGLNITGISIGIKPFFRVQIINSGDHFPSPRESGKRGFIFSKAFRDISLYVHPTSVSVGPLCKISKNFATAQLPKRTEKGMKAPDQILAREVLVPKTTSKS